MSYVEKIISDIIQTTSDLFSPLLTSEKQFVTADTFFTNIPFYSTVYANPMTSSLS